MAKRRPRPAVDTGPGAAHKIEELVLELAQGEGSNDGGNDATPSLIPIEITWSRRKGDRVKKGTELASIKCKQGDSEITRKLIATQTGTIEEIIQVDLPFTSSSSDAAAPPTTHLLLGRMSYCTHPYLQNERMCAVCGEVVAQKDGTAVATTRVFVKGGHHVSVSKSEADSLHRSMFIKLSKSRKLNLILDIDLTLLHATIDQRADLIKDEDVHAFDVTNQGRLLRHWCKLRPGLKDFLSKAHELYVLSIYTHGRRDYAHQVAKLLDPDRSLFGDRVVSRDDCPDLQGQKSLERLFPGGIEMALILDDTPHVWQGEQSRHLLQVVPFRYYTDFEELNRITTGPAAVASAPSKQIYGDPKADDQLSHTLRILGAVHALYYPPIPSSPSSSTNGTTKAENGGGDDDESHLDNLINGRPKNVAHCLATYRKQWLAGMSLVFSGLLPRNTDPRRSDLGYMAQALGARVTEALTEETTHVVAENPNTEKVYHASRRKGVHVVTRMWLLMSFWHCERKDEADFRLIKGGDGAGSAKSAAAGENGGQEEEEEEEKGEAMETDDGGEEGGPTKKHKKETNVNGVGGGEAGGEEKMEEQQQQEEEAEEVDVDEQERLANLLADDLM